ncbi:hypothetical protein E1301_Tti012618 [Triplophysa tibetana]|uniref:Uncharacterized protein n=1 Tax=Triplophysa tibetana TaxID=1572043 RepID=A0A5A9NNS9_9TELE|nr:hypothetical protein E1301_Tti012618 [Triplophysa tibetana]
MSRRSSAGDLVPKDITEILALQAGKKKRGSSLSRAFSWFKSSKRKRSLSNGQSRTGDPGGRSGESTTTKQIHAGGEHCKVCSEADRQGGRVSYTHTRAQSTHAGSQAHLRAGHLCPCCYSRVDELEKEYKYTCRTPGDFGIVEPEGPEIKAMGNSNSKKKTQASFSTAQHTSRVKSIWYFKHVDKFKAGQKPDDERKLCVHYTAAQHYQENVFIEGCRPQYLQDLHTEAREGLKISQQEEHRNGLDFQDDQSMPIDASSRERDESLDTDSTAGHSIISASSISAVSSRPVLTRQGSTFKPLNPIKRLDKTNRRSRRTTILGIPQQVQKELDMARGTTLHLPKDEHYGQDDLSGRVVIPTIDGEPPPRHHEGARVHLQNIEVRLTSGDEDLLMQHIQSVYLEDLSVSRKLGLGPCPMQRPKSLAVPGMITSCLLQEPQGPVMSISPQATYLSKIIPNAVLPAAIDIIEINHGIYPHSISMIGRGSSAASPASTRSGGRTSKGQPTISILNRTHSQSSETVVSNSSTISSKEKGPPVCVADGIKNASDLNPKDKCVSSSNSEICSDSKCRNQRLEHRDCFSRNLSVMKTKLPPAPPQRTYSLHHELKLKRRTKEGETTNGQNLTSKKEDDHSFKEDSSSHSLAPNPSRHFESSPTSSPISPDQTRSSSSSPHKISSSESKFDRTLSPSSGYSSQSGTPTHSPKEVSPSSPGNRRVKPSKPNRAGVRTSPVVSVSSSMTSLSSVTSDTAHQDIQTNTTLSEPLKPLLFPPVTNPVTPIKPKDSLRELFNIPPPPKVKAPSTPPPETWIQNKRTFELLCGPDPNIYRLQKLQKLQKLNGGTPNTDTIHNIERIIPEIQTADETNAQLERKELVVPPQVHEQMMSEPTTRSTFHNDEGPASHNKSSQSIQTQDLGNVENQTQTVSDTEVPTIEVDQPQTNCEIERNAQLVSKSTPKCYKINAENQRDPIVQEISNHKLMHTLSIEVPEINGISPPPSPPPEHQPPPPPSKHPSASPDSIPAMDEVEQGHDTEVKATSLESSWPPPPPPLDESAELMFEEQDELEFPAPPPLIIYEPLIETSGKCKESSEEHVDIELVSKEVSDMENSPVVQISEFHNILATRTVPNCRVLDDKPKSCTSVSQIYIENTTVDSPKTSHLLQVEDLIYAKPNISEENSSEEAFLDIQAESTDVANAPPLSMEDQSAVNFRRQPGPINQDNRSKDLLCRHKNAPIPMEDANIPLVTPSLLHMVRLRSVNVKDQVTDDSKTSPESTTKKDQQTCSQETPQKPIRKSLTLKSLKPTVTSPSMCLQEAIRLKTAALSSGGVAPKPNLHLASTGVAGSPSDLHKSHASTASFIFSKSTKKVVIETATSPDAQPGLSQNLAAEITQISDPAKMMITNGTKNPIKVPPPVAKKPMHGTNPHYKPENATTDKTNEHTVRVNWQSNAMHPAGQRAKASASQVIANILYINK